MSSPKFSAGDKVAVCTRFLEVVLPEARITDCRYEFGGAVATHPLFLTDMPSRSGFVYRISNGPVSKLSGASCWYHETSLRPIIDGEYEEDTQDIQSPIERGVSA